MSVPSWKRSVSKSEYIRMLYDLNVRIGQIVMNKPKKYRGSYADMLIKSSLEALKYAQVANSIFMAASTPNEDYILRRKYLLKARGTVENIATTSQIFLELCRNADREEAEKIYREEAYIGESCGEIVRKISGVLKSDASIFKKKNKYVVTFCIWFSVQLVGAPPNASNTTNFCNVNSDGTANNNNASNTRGIAPFGCFHIARRVATVKLEQEI